MTKVASIIGLVVVITLALALGVIVYLAPKAEVPSSELKQIEGGSSLRVVRFDGHEYIAFHRGGGGSLCHSESCPCKK